MTLKLVTAQPQILHFTIQLRDIEPAIWRRIEVPASYTFWDLHVAIQDAMGWLDCHLHVFRIRDRRTGTEAEIGIPDPDPFPGAPEVLPGWRVPVTSYLANPGDRARYDYDFGDGWEHDLVPEQVGPRLARTRYPRCVAGARACPPEDCGGPVGYARLLDVLADPAHPEHASLLAWLDGPFDAEEFDPREVRFDNPKKRWQVAFGKG